MRALYFLFFILSYTVFAQNLEIKKLGIQQGLSSNYALSISQDAKGFVWIATESGLNVFDGQRFKVYRKGALSGNELNKVFADKHQDLVWIATQREGLNCLDLSTGKFEHFVKNEKDINSIITNDITDITSSKDGNLWLSTYHKGVEYFDKKNKRFIHYNTNTLPQLKSNNVWTLAEDARGILYIGHVNSGLSVFDPKTKSVKNYGLEHLPGSEIKALFIDKNQKVWIGTNQGLVLFDPENEHFFIFKKAQAYAHSGLDNAIYTIAQTADGKIWVGTENGGISILNLTQDVFSNTHKQLWSRISYRDDAKGLSNATVRSIFQDSFNNIWIGTYGGGVNFIGHYEPYFNSWKYSPVQSLPNVLNNPTAWGIVHDKQGKVWIGTDGGGINVFENGVRKQILHLNASNVKEESILAALLDQQGYLWFGTFNGTVAKVTTQGQIAQKWNIQNTDVRCFYQDPAQTIWVGGSFGLYNIQKGQHFTTQNSGLTSNHVRSIVSDKQGNLWVGTFGDGIAILDSKLHLIKKIDRYSGLPSNTVNHLILDHKNQIWAATGEGLVQFKDFEIDSIFNEEKGIHNSHIRAIAEDAKGDIWMSSIGGISRIETGNANKVYNYWGQEGMPWGDFMSGSVTKDQKGNLYFGSQEGLTFFNPAALPQNQTLPPVIFTELSVYDKKLSNNEIPILIANQIKLKYSQNTFRVAFNNLDYSLHSLTEYSYKLKGLADVWYTTENEDHVTFRNIPPGKYELLVRSRFKNQDWSPEIAQITLFIQPPFWLAWWAKLLYIAIILAGVYYFLKSYKRKLALEQSLEIEKRSHIKDQEVHEERIRFFTNITHELKTPLTLILGPLDDLKQDASLGAQHQSKVSVIHKSTSKLLGLINQILDFHKSENQLKELKVTEGDIGSLVKEMGQKYKDLNSNNAIAIETFVPEHLKKLYYDPKVIATILENLLSNALKYTEKGNIRLEINQTEHLTEIAVKDTGRGIPKESLSKIFERYYQVAEDSKVAGTGIGLALVQSLVNLHQAQIVVQSELGKGSVFKLVLQNKAQYPQVKSIIIKKLKEPEIENSDKPIVLVVEDHLDILKYIEKSLSYKYKVITATNGKEGLEEAYKHIPDLIISDIMMPQVDGLTMSETLKKDLRTSHIPIILLTAKDSLNDREKGYLMGIDSYLTKPFSSGVILSRVDNILAARAKWAVQIQAATANEGISPMDNAFIQRITELVQTNIDSEEIDVEYLAQKLHMSYSTLYRKVKALTGFTVNELIRKIRIQQAAKWLLTGQYTISEVSFMVGINSTVYFRQCFKEEFGMNPSEYVKKHKV